MGMFTNDPRPMVMCDQEKGAKQQFKDECDINRIMEKYRVSGMVTHLSKNLGRYVDVSEVGSYHEAVTRVIETRGFFAGLSADMRKEFDHDPAVFLDFISDPENIAKIHELGLDGVINPRGEAVAEVEAVVEAAVEEVVEASGDPD